MELADVPRYRPLAFDKMESLIKEMQDPETGVPVRCQKLFLTVIPSAFMGYDLVEWIMDRFNLDEASNVEAINLANQLCQYGYIFPVNDLKGLMLKDDSSLYRFQSPYYWPWQGQRGAGGGSSAPSLGPDNVEYAIYLVKRTLRNKQRHGLDDHEQEALANLKKNLAAKWDFITMQAEEQVRIAKERKKGDKIVSDSQERAYWRVARPQPGAVSVLEPCPVPVRARHHRHKKRTIHQVTREIEHLRACLDRTRVKTSIALEALVAYSETFAPYDPWLTPPQPSNPWVSDDTLFWQINSPLVEVPSEKRVQRWAISIEELVSDPTGLQEFTSFLRKEYSHENIRFWLAVMDLRRSSIKQIPSKLQNIFEEFLKPGAPCEINIDGATAERVAEGMRSGSRYALDHAADHVYSLLLKKDCYPRFVRSDHFQRLLAEGKNVHQKKAKFFNFGGQVKRKPGVGGSGAVVSGGGGGAGAGGGGPALARRRGSERSLSGSAHELAVCAAQPPRAPDAPSHSHSQSNLADIIPFRDPMDDDTADVLPWECSSRDYGSTSRRRQDSAADSGSSSSDVSAVVSAGERLRRLPQQSTLDGGLRGAAPPLRRLSAVEPRHLTPLASPPHSPRPPRPTQHAPPTITQPHAHPTPTISVSSAPDDESANGSPEDPRSIAQSDEPSSVFASADATPTEPVRHAFKCDGAELPSDSSPEKAKDSASTRQLTSVIGAPSVDSCDNSGVSESRDSTDRTKSSEDEIMSVRRKLSREPSTVKEISPASTKEICNIADFSSHDAATSCTQVVKLTITEPDSTEKLKNVESSSSIPITSASIAEASATIVITSANMPESSGLVPETSGPAPLAVCEDIGVDDDGVVKVPSAPLQRVSEDSRASKANETKNIAHKVELRAVSETTIVKRDNKSISERTKQRNDICPWEDELAPQSPESANSTSSECYPNRNSCESDAPFVKTYATLGYL